MVKDNKGKDDIKQWLTVGSSNWWCGGYRVRKEARNCLMFLDKKTASVKTIVTLKCFPLIINNDKCTNVKVQKYWKV